MTIQTKCDICEKAIKITPTVNDKVKRDGLTVLCKNCWNRMGMKRDRYFGQIQSGYYLATN